MGCSPDSGKWDFKHPHVEVEPLFPMTWRTVQTAEFDRGFLRAPSGSHLTSHISGKKLCY